MLYKRILILLIIGYLMAGCNLGLQSVRLSLPIRTAEQECVAVKPDLPIGFLADGTILLGDFLERAGIGKIMKLTSTSTQLIYLPNVPIYWNGETSPDRKWFAYDTGKEEATASFTATLIVLDTDGKVQSTLPWNEKWNGFVWLNDQQLEFPYVWDDYWQKGSPISDIFTLPTGQLETVAPPLPDPWIPGGSPIIGLVVWKAVFDPTLSVVGYMRGNEPEQSFVLWDLKNNKPLWELNKWSLRETRPEWTSDGKTLAVATLNQEEDDFDRFELYLVDKDSHAGKWIDIKGYFKNASLNMSWSPDGRYLAIVPNGEQSFLILDTVAKELLDYCIPANTGYSSGIWSADSSQIIIPRENDSTEPSIVLDIEKKRAAYLTSNPKYRPIGWLASSP